MTDGTWVDRHCFRCGKLFQVWRYVDSLGSSWIEGSHYCPDCDAREIADAVVREPVYQIEVHAT